jgi:hypothetical protein
MRNGILVHTRGYSKRRKTHSVKLHGKFALENYFNLTAKSKQQHVRSNPIEGGEWGGGDWNRTSAGTKARPAPAGAPKGCWTPNFINLLTGGE